MLISLVKFIHVLLTISLLGSVMYCLALTDLQKILRVKKIMLVIALFAVITGTLLVYPKNFTFHTPWIQAAYVLVGTFCLLLVLLLFLKQKVPHSRKWLWRGAYILLMVILVLIIHDAVTKVTFLF